MKKSIRLFLLQILLSLAILLKYPDIPKWRIGVFLMIGVLYMIWKSSILQNKDGYWFGLIPPRKLLTDRQTIIYNLFISIPLLLLVSWLSKSPVLLVIGVVALLIGVVREFNK